MTTTVASARSSTTPIKTEEYALPALLPPPHGVEAPCGRAAAAVIIAGLFLGRFHERASQGALTIVRVSRLASTQTGNAVILQRLD